jgi:preprotein translocase subunit SecY
VLASLAAAFRLPDVRKRILFVFGMFAVYTLGAFVPLPGIDREAMENLFKGGGGLLGLWDAFAGGSLKRFSIFALGIMPYINASIIFQLLTIAIPSLEQLAKEGEWGRKKISQWTRYLTMGLAVLQGWGMTTLFRGWGAFEADIPHTVLVVLTMTAGTAFLMWLADQITDKGIGNGVSLVIFAGIMTRLPSDIGQTILLWSKAVISFLNVGLLAVLFLGTVAFIVFVQQAQRKIPVQYASRVIGMNRMTRSVSSYLPLKVNQAGVIPIIFAVSVAMFPATVSQFLLSDWLVGKIAAIGGWDPSATYATINNLVRASEPGGSIWSSLVYFALVIIFTYFYTAVTFDPVKIADDMKKNGGFVPGIRPGKPTREYLDRVLTRVTLAGAVFLGIIAVMQYHVQDITGVTTFNLVGGTSLLIVVGVALETMQQLEAHLLMRHYEGFMK